MTGRPEPWNLYSSDVKVFRQPELLEEHEAPGPVTLSVMSGRIRLQAPASGKHHDLGPGDIAVMTADARHAVEGLEESTILVVIGGDQTGA